MTTGPDPATLPRTALALFAAELRRLRELRGLSQRELAAVVAVYSRSLLSSVELGQRWPPSDLARRCDAALGSGGVLERLWPVVDAERNAARQVVIGHTVGQLRQAVLRLAVLTGTDLSVLAVAGADGAAGDGWPQSIGAGDAIAVPAGTCGDGSVQ